MKLKGIIAGASASVLLLMGCAVAEATETHRYGINIQTDFNQELAEKQMIREELRKPTKDINLYWLLQNATVKDTKGLTDRELHHRNGDLVVWRTVGYCKNAEGKGQELDSPYYINYREVDGVKAGDIVASYFILNPYSSAEDDILHRMDYIIDHLTVEDATNALPEDYDALIEALESNMAEEEKT